MEPHWKFGIPPYEIQTRMLCATSRLLVIDVVLYFQPSREVQYSTMDLQYDYPMMDGSFFPGIGDYYGDQEDTSFLKETDISKTTVIVNCIHVALFYFI